MTISEYVEAYYAQFSKDGVACNTCWSAWILDRSGVPRLITVPPKLWRDKVENGKCPTCETLKQLIDKHDSNEVTK